MPSKSIGKNKKTTLILLWAPSLTTYIETPGVWRTLLTSVQSINQTKLKVKVDTFGNNDKGTQMLFTVAVVLLWMFGTSSGTVNYCCRKINSNKCIYSISFPLVLWVGWVCLVQVGNSSCSDRIVIYRLALGEKWVQRQPELLSKWACLKNKIMLSI